MKLIDNINDLLGDDLKKSMPPGARLKIAASCFSIYAYEALKRELESVESFEFIFTSPSFMPDEVTDAAKKERREFHIPKSDTERSFYGTEFEVQLKNKLTQRAIARECADWMRRKAKFRSNSGPAPMQQFAAVQTHAQAEAPNAVYMPLHGFTAVDLGYQRGNAVSNIVNKFDEPGHTGVFLSLFDQIWADPGKLKDVTSLVCSATLEVESLVGKGWFPFPKNTDVLAELIELVTGPDDLIVDFFAGSGSTGHAVWNVNQAQRSKRQFILVQVPELTGREAPSVLSLFKM